MNKTRASFTHSSILARIRSAFKSGSHGLDLGNKAGGHNKISLTDCFMSAVAIFSLKYKSLLQFEEDRHEEECIRNNLHTMYGVKNVPCDTYLRERLDGQYLRVVRTAMASLINLCQRSKVLEDWRFLDGKYLVPLDATGFFSSKEVRCDCCCEKVHNRGTDKESITYHHQILAGCIASPDRKQVLPLGFEPIVKADGSTKNDCERNAGKRWLNIFRKTHPKLSVILAGDGLYSNAPFIRDCQSKRCSYILVAKEADHKSLYEYFWAGKDEDIGEFEVDNKDYKQSFRFMNDVPLNDANHDVKVNVLHFTEYNKKKNKTTKWVWITDIKITKNNVVKIMQGGRVRWKIENETFNTLKNQGYNFKHNFGHGYNGLSNNFAAAMLLAFMIDQILEAVNLEFKAVLKKFGSRYNCFEKIRNKFFEYKILSYERLYEVMATGPPKDRWL